MSQSHKRVWLGVGALVLVAAGVGAWAVGYRGAPAETTTAVPAEFAKDRLTALAQEDPGKMWEALRGLEDRTDLTEQQREQIRDQARELMELQMQQRLDEYFAAPPEVRVAILDKQIDEMQARRGEWERRRQQEESNPQAQAEREKRREERRQRMAQMSQAERKSRSESRDPNKSAQRMAYFGAMERRMKERGMEPPQRGPGGRGGFGGLR